MQAAAASVLPEAGTQPGEWPGIYGCDRAKLLRVYGATLRAALASVKGDLGTAQVRGTNSTSGCKHAHWTVKSRVIALHLKPAVLDAAPSQHASQLRLSKAVAAEDTMGYMVSCHNPDLKHVSWLARTCSVGLVLHGCCMFRSVSVVVCQTACKECITPRAITECA